MDHRGFITLLYWIAVLNVAASDHITVLNSPDGVRLSNAKSASLSDVSALPYHLFGIDKSQSGLIADVSFLRRPRLLVVATVACGGGAGCPLALPVGGRQLEIREDSGLLLFDETSGLRRALRRHSLPKSVVARTGDADASTNAGLFASLRESALANEASLPAGWDRLVAELRRVEAIAQALVNSKLLNDSQPDLLHVEINSLAGQSVPDDVQKFVADFLRRLASKLDSAAGNRAFVVVATVAEAAPLARLGRSLMAVAEPTQAPADSGINLAADYDKDFPIMFNLILWLCVVLALAVYAVGYSLWNIDPGRDSIIYRRGYAHAKVD